MSWYQMLVVFAGGGLGSALRYVIGWSLGDQRSFYAGTLTVNLTASFFIGLFYHQYQLDPERAWIRLFLITGLCGGLSTFSTLSHENLQLIQQLRWTELLAYNGLSLVAGIALVWVGFRTGQWMNH